MKPELSKKSADFRRNISPVRQIMNMADPAFYRKNNIKPTEVISFAGGWVNHEAPPLMQKIYRDIVSDAKSFHQSGGYSPTLGMPECREAIVNFEKHIHNMEGLALEQVAVGASSTQQTSDIFKVLLNPDDKILLLDPSYCNIPSQVITAIGAPIIRFPVVDAESWQYIAGQKSAEFAEFIGKNRPKVVLLISPDNPSSQIVPDSFVRAALDAVTKIGSFLVIDFAYKEIVFTEKVPDYYAWTPNDNYISIHSNSKWCRGLGRRLSWVEAPEFVVKGIESIQSSSVLCPDTLHQMAFTRYVNEALKEDSLKSYVENVRNLYAKTARSTSEFIDEYVGVPHFIPQGGLYNCLYVNTDGAQFVEEMLKRAAVLLVPGWGFGRSQIKAVRISYGPLVHDIDTIALGMRKIGQCLRQEQRLTITA